MAARISKEEFEEKVIKNPLPVLVYFYSDSCVACKNLAPVLGGIEDDYEGQIAIYKVNTGYEPELVEQYEITANPTLLLIKNGDVLDRKTGAQSPVALEEWLKKYL